MKYDSTFHEAHTLADGTHVTLRFIRPDDADELRRQFARLSPESRYRRFLSGATELTDDKVRYLTETDGVNHVAIVATTESLDLRSEIGLGVARFIKLADEPHVAEAAVTVVDEMQGKGIGRLLLVLLGKIARDRGVHTIRAEVLASNEPMREILREVGAVVRADDGLTMAFDIPVAAAGDAAEHASPLRRLFRAIAGALTSLGAG